MGGVAGAGPRESLFLRLFLNHLVADVLDVNDCQAMSAHARRETIASWQEGLRWAVAVFWSSNATHEIGLNQLADNRFSFRA
jgi:hypothetical protein